MNHSRFSRAASVLTLALLVSVVLVPSAHAQLAGGVGDAVGSVGDSVLGGGGSTESSGGLVGGVTDSLEGGSSGADSDTTTDDGGGGGGLVGGVVNTIDKTVEKSKETVTEVTEATSDTLGTVGSGTLEGVVGAVEGTVGKVGKDLGDKDVKKQRNTRPAATRTATNPATVLGNSLADALRSDAKTITPVISRSTDTTTVASAPVNQSLVEQIGKIAAEAVKQAAFPIALILLVVGFLMIQNRMDSRDPKLALAPVDSQHDSLSFT